MASAHGATRETGAEGGETRRTRVNTYDSFKYYASARTTHYFF